MRLKSYTSGPFGRVFTIENTVPSYTLQTYVYASVDHYQLSSLSGTISQSNKNTIFGDHLTYPLVDINTISKEYDPSSGDIKLPQTLDVIDMTQIGDVSFALTKEDFETVGTQLKLSPDITMVDGNPIPTQDLKRFSPPIWPNIHSETFILSASSTLQTSPSVAHEIASYYAMEDVTGRVLALTARMQKDWTEENGVASMPDSIFSTLSASYITDAENLKRELFFDIEKRIYDTTFDYYEKPKLICSSINGTKYTYMVGSDYMGYSQGIPANYVLEMNLDHDYASPFKFDKILVNPMKLKNIYDNSFQTEMDSENSVLKGFRSYTGIGTMQDSIWLSYKYSRDIVEDEEYWNFTRNFQFVERIKGLYKMASLAKHKSNIFSIRIKDSGLNGDISQGQLGKVLSVYESLQPAPIGLIGNVTTEDAKTKLRSLVETEVKTMLEKIAPTETQLWQILWEGR